MNLDSQYLSGIKQTSIDVPTELWVAAKQNLIELRATLIFGIEFKLAEIGIATEYPENPLSKNILRLTKIIQEQAEKIEELKEAALSGTTQADTMQVTKTAEQEFDEVMQKHEQ